MLHELRLAVRALSRQRSFTLAALATVALGLATTTAMFAVVYGVLLRPLPYPEADRLVQLSEVVPGGTPAISGPMISTISLRAWEPHRRTIGPIAHFAGGSVTVGFDRPQRLERGIVAPHFFDVIGVLPVIGRFFVEEDAWPGAPPVAVISAEVWRDRFTAVVRRSRTPAGRGRTLRCAVLLVERRQREIGVGSALGATRGRLIGMIVSEGVTVTLLGLALGVLLAAGATRFMQSLLVGVAPIDPWSFGVAALALLAVAFVASAVPARRALRVDPITALRTD